MLMDCAHCMNLKSNIGLKRSYFELFKNKEALIPGNLHTRLLIIGVKDNNIMEDYHGTSMSLFQFPSTVNLGEKRYSEKFIKVS